MKKELIFKPFDELTNNAPQILYNPDLEQTIPFIVERYTSNGIVKNRAAHVLRGLEDSRFIQREKDFAEQSKNKSFFVRTAPTEKLWDDLALSRIGYKPRDDWKQKVKSEEKIDVINALTQILADGEEKEEWADVLLDDEEISCFQFRVFFGGIKLEEYQEWFTSGNLPENITFIDSEDYERACQLVRSGISPSLYLKVAHYFKDADAKQLDEFLSIENGTPNPNRLASATKELEIERLKVLYDAVADSNEGYVRVPIWHKATSIRIALFAQMARMGKSRA